MTTLLHLPYSPWSEAARWALDARGIAYTPRRYQPLLGEPSLRLVLRRWTGRVSVPVLQTDDGPIADAAAIARWADARGSGPQLFPAGSEREVEHWIARAEQGMSAGRALSLTRVLASDDALDELTPRPLRRLGGAARAITRAGVARTRRKYGGSQHADAEHQATLEDVLAELRSTLTGRATVLAGFCYADIVAAQVLCFVAPPDTPHLRIGRANRAAFGDPALAARYADLLTWRDALYRSYRG